jgi:hypothetical protein
VRYLQRDAAGKLVGHYANPQTTRDGVPYTEPEPVPDDHPDIVAWDAERKAAEQEAVRTSDVVGRMTVLEAENAETKRQLEELRRLVTPLG